MDYDFASLCVDQIEKLQKRMTSFHKACVNEYVFAMNVINSPQQNEHRQEILTAIEDALRDQMKKNEIFYTETLLKIQRELKKFL